MRLLSATVRSYRIHEAVTVDFNDARTLIGGPNESGKSTLIEAVHRALFLKATVGGEARESMLSTSFPGHPQVEIRFSACGNEYQLTKRFSGQSGTATLVQVGGQSWHGQEAESQLAALLGVEEARGHRGILDRVERQWSHVWVWQGKSWGDPILAAASEQDSLLKQLQETGGAVVMQSEKDSRVASFFRDRRAEIYTQAGSPKRNSDLGQAEDAWSHAENGLAAAEQRLRNLAQAVQDFEDASATIERAGSDLDELTRQQRDVNDKTLQLQELRRVEERQIADAEQAAEKLEALEAVETSVRDLRESVRILEESLVPRREERERLQNRAAEVRGRKEEAETAYDQAVDVMRDVRLRYELADAYAKRFHKKDRAEELSRRMERVKQLQDELDGVQREIAQLGSIDQDALDALRELDRELGEASASLQAMATEIEVVAANQPVRLANVPVAAGTTQIVSDPTDVTIGDGVTLRIRPGGGDNLVHAREEVSRLRKELQRALDDRGLESIGQAGNLVATRNTLQARLVSAEASLEQWKPEELLQNQEMVQRELVELEADIKRRTERIDGIREPETLQDAATWFEGEQASLRAQEADDARKRSVRDALREQLAEAENSAKESRESLEEDERGLTFSKGQLQLLLGKHGTDDERTQTLEKARRAKTEADEHLAQTVFSIAALQPELLEGDKARLERAADEAQGQIQDAEIKRGASQALLRSDGAEDPDSSVIEARAKRDRARDYRNAVARKAQAIAAIDDMFRQEQHALADQFSQPLAEKVDGYLQCLFGPDAHVSVSFEGNTFKDIKLVRSGEGGTTFFDSLSGGTREQVAAAVRLAIAELLAAGHDNSLPVVFDDSFAYSDPQRVQILQRMLDLAAARGLQVIVLTCNPSDYAGLGAKQVSLN